MDCYIFENVIILIPASLAWIHNWLQKKFGENYPTKPGFTIFEGTGDYCAFAKNEGIAMGDEGYWVEELSSQLEESIYSLWTHDDAIDTIHTYRSGKLIESDWEDFFEFAESLGVELPGKPEPQPTILFSVCLVIDFNPNDIPESVIQDCETVNVSQSKLGVIFNSKNGGARWISTKLRELFQSQVVYVIYKTSDGRMHFYLYKGWEDIGDYVLPPFESRESTLKNIEGETDPKKILEKLDIPLTLLGFDS